MAHQRPRPRLGYGDVIMCLMKILYMFVLKMHGDDRPEGFQGVASRSKSLSCRMDEIADLTTSVAILCP